MAKENIMFSIEEETAREFKKQCIDNKVTYSEVIENFMKEYSEK